MVLELNEYVRTKDGIIAKVIGLQSGGIEKYYFDKEIIDNFKELTQIGTENVVLKHSFNIIDLIEKGDFVNRLEIERIIEPSQYTNYKKTLYCSESEGLYKGVFFNNDIKSVVTHEQMEAMEYEVK